MGSVVQSLVWLLFSFDGRIPRRVWVIAFSAVTAVAYVIHLSLVALFAQSPPPWTVSAPFALVTVWILLALQTKRWHDRNQSGWSILVILIFVLGKIYAFIELFLLRGTVGENRYGDDPM